jgi:hypothetical protein
VGAPLSNIKNNGAILGCAPMNGRRLCEDEIC